MMLVLEQRPVTLPLAPACRALGLNRSSVYARRQALLNPLPKQTSRKASSQPRALSEPERQAVREILDSERFCDQPPAQVHAALLDEGINLCSVSSMHRVLREAQENGERRLQRPAQHNAIPRLRATRPNEVWTWDITKLATVRRGEYLSLYIVLDLFSRFIVAWMVSRKENSALAQQLMREGMTRYAIAAGQLTIHQDRGSPMIAHGYLDLLAELGATGSHSRPRVSNDNPFSESQFKTLKYQPDYPGQFTGVGHAQQWCEDYVDWYNFTHYHSGLARYTPAQVFTGQHVEIDKDRHDVLQRSYDAHPERFVRGRPKVPALPTEVLINPVIGDDGKIDTTAAVNFPTLRMAKKSLTSD